MPARRRTLETVEPTVHGEDALAGIEAVKIRLENGAIVTHRVADELAVPEDPRQLEIAARKSSARLAYWLYQTELALDAVRTLERELDTLRGILDFRYRANFMESEGDYREGMVSAAVNIDRDAIQLRKKLDHARKQHGLLRSVSKAMERRDFVLGQLLDKQRKAFQ